MANAKRKKIIVADRFPFRYLADELSLAYSAAFPGCSTETDVSAATMAYLINEVKSGSYPYIYYIELSSQKVANTLAEETGAKPIILHSAHNLTDSDFKNGVTYVSIMRQNVKNLKLGLE
jgi:zinc transport system substrate-binding protein